MFYYHANKTHFHKKVFALGLVLGVRVFGTRKWAIKAHCLIITITKFSILIGHIQANWIPVIGHLLMCHSLTNYLHFNGTLTNVDTLFSIPTAWGDNSAAACLLGCSTRIQPGWYSDHVLCRCYCSSGAESSTISGM